MKLYRSDLEQFISNQLFEISADTLDLDDLQFAGDTISCVCSVETASKGYRIHGHVSADVQETCDRCLAEFVEAIQSKFNVILTNDETLIADQNMDVIPFADSEESIDLTSVIHDVVLLAEPFKRLCNETCKGMCSSCGTNLNESTCDCHDTNSDSRWDALKNLKN